MNARPLVRDDGTITDVILENGNAIPTDLSNTCPNKSGVENEGQVIEAQGVAPSDANQALVAEIVEPLAGFPRPAPLGCGRMVPITPQHIQQLCMLLSTGLSRRQAASYVGINHTTLSHMASRDPELAEALARAEELSHTQCVLRIAHESRKNWRAAAWLLTHKAKAPPPKLTPEEKQEEHQEKMDELKRSYERRTLEESLGEELKEARAERALKREQKKNEKNHAAWKAGREIERQRKEQRRAQRESGAA
jgi:hypothetical protein